MTKLNVRLLSTLALLSSAAPMAEASAAAQDGEGSSAESLTVNNCTEGQVFGLFWSIWPEARRVATDGSNYVSVDPNRFSAQNWFGSPVSQHALDTLREIETTMANEDADILCDDGHPSCNGNLARAQGTNTIRICPDFWTISYDEQVITLLHELSHHHGAPDDGPSTPDAAFALARANAEAAAKNAYNYEFFYGEFL